MSQEQRSWVHGVLSILTKLEEQPCTSAVTSAACPTVPSGISSPVTTQPSCFPSVPASVTTTGSPSPYQLFRQRYKKPKVQSSTGHATRHPSKRKRKYILEDKPDEKTIRIRCRCWQSDSYSEYHTLRVHKNGTIHVLHGTWWIEADETDLTYRQQRQMRYICWGSTREVDSYSKLAEVPRTEVGRRFWIRGEPENDGLYELVDYFHSGGSVRLRRVLPNYQSMELRKLDRTSSTPWPKGDTDGTESTSETDSSGDIVR